MPFMGGMEATELIRAFELHEGLDRTPIIALTAHASTYFVPSSFIAPSPAFISCSLFSTSLHSLHSRFVQIPCLVHNTCFGFLFQLYFPCFFAFALRTSLTLPFLSLSLVIGDRERCLQAGMEIGRAHV